MSTSQNRSNPTSTVEENLGLQIGEKHSGVSHITETKEDALERRKAYLFIPVETPPLRRLTHI